METIENPLVELLAIQQGYHDEFKTADLQQLFYTTKPGGEMKLYDPKPVIFVMTVFRGGDFENFLPQVPPARVPDGVLGINMNLLFSTNASVNYYLHNLKERIFHFQEWRIVHKPNKHQENVKRRELYPVVTDIVQAAKEGFFIESPVRMYIKEKILYNRRVETKRLIDHLRHFVPSVFLNEQREKNNVLLYQLPEEEGLAT